MGLLFTAADPLKYSVVYLWKALSSTGNDLTYPSHTHTHTHAYFTCQNINTTQKFGNIMFTENSYLGSHRTVTEKAVFKCN